MRRSGLKKGLALALSLCLCLSLLPVGALAAAEVSGVEPVGGMLLPAEETPIGEEILTEEVPVEEVSAEDPPVIDASPVEETEVSVEEAPVPEETPEEIEHFSWINPLYAQWIDPEELPEAERVPLDGATPTISTAADAAAYVRQQFVARTEEVTFVYYGDVSAAIEQAMAHTGKPREGDSLLYQLGGYSGNRYSDGTVVLRFSYYTTAAQEKMVDAEVVNILKELDLPRATDYATVEAVHDYLCDTVTYGKTDMTAHSTYGALVKQYCVCQGYALAMYRLLLECGIDCRIIGGEGGGGPHAWNIVKLGNLYYSLDATWDDQEEYGTMDDYFLIGKTEFYKDHTPTEDPSGNDMSWSSDFWDDYPMSFTNYDPAASGGTSGDTNGIIINQYVFPDTIFRTYVANYLDTDLNGRLSAGEIDRVTELDVSELGIMDLTGVSLFTELQQLECYGNYLTELDVSGLINLQYLDASGNWLDSLTLGTHPELWHLYCEENRLETLDLSGCPELVQLWCQDNLLEKLDVSECSYLQVLWCSGNYLEALNVSGCPELVLLWCQDNLLEELDVSECGYLQDLWCSGNYLEALDVSGCPALAALAEVISPSYYYDAGIVDYYFEFDDGSYYRLTMDIGVALRTRERLGDVNGDGYVTKADAALVLAHTVGKGTLTGDAAHQADVNLDETIDARDAAQILRFANGSTSVIQ